MDKEKRYCVTSKTMSLPSILVHLHILLMTASSVFSYVHFTEENFPGNPDISLQKMTLDPTTNTLYVGSVNRLYKLNSDLEEEIHRDTGPVSDHPTCFPPPGQCTTQEFSREATNNIIKILLVDNNRLITCGSVYQGTCQVRSLEDFTPLGNNTSEEIAANTRIGTSVGFISRGPENRANVLYTATSSADWIDNNVPTVSVRSLPEVIPSRNLFSVLKTGFRAVSQIVIPAETVSESPNGFNITYVYGFPSGNFSYFVGVQPENHRTLPREVQYYTKLIRICQRDINLLSYIELPLKCYSGGVDYNIAQSAYIAKAGKDGGEPWQNEDALFVTFAQSEEHDREPQRKSAVCMYLVSDLNQAFFDRRRECVNGHQSDTQMEWYKSVPCTEVGKTPALLVERMDREGRNYCHTLDFIGPMGGTDSPIIAQAIHVDDSTLFTAIAVSHKPQESAIFVGDDTGHLLKLMLTSQSKASVSTDHEIVPDGSVVQNGLLLSLDEEYVYVMTQRQVS
ncbi:plexin-A4-like [Lytechinus variegatus]|uniref:plexin-A4-like n=1 Tax=Lytechinus variegatus TaxID=7654 RepID=UPI001BB25DAE|nr:plexin-A4-like [Lytechinus variegatus]